MVSETPVAQEPFDTSISEDRRHEISQLMNDAGFRKDVDPSVTDITDNAGLDLSSPSRQLEEMAHDATILASEVSEPQSPASPKLPSQGASNTDSQLIHLEPFHPFSDLTSEPSDQPRVAYPKLVLPPSEAGSLHSGRQVDPDFSIELGNDLFPDVDDPVTTSRSTLGRHSDDEQDAQEHLAKEKVDNDGGSDAESDASDSSFESLSELWASRSTNGSKSSASKQAVMDAIKARKPDNAPDLEYEETMRRLDDSPNMSEDDNPGHVSELAQKLVDKPIEKPSPKKSSKNKGALKPSSIPQIKAERVSPSPAGAARSSSTRTARASDSPFAIPEGSQVVSLLTSSPEPEPEIQEHYAEDDIDETYKGPAGSMPTGLGWVSKPRARRGVSMPASSAARKATPKFLTSSQAKSMSVTEALSRAKKKVRSNMNVL
jgi:hypothetical protein